MACAASAQTKTGFNAKFFFNQNQIDATTRQSGTTADTIYQMLPKMHTLSYSDVVGWKGVLQDENYNTAEKVGFWHRQIRCQWQGPGRDDGWLRRECDRDLELPEADDGHSQRRDVDPDPADQGEDPVPSMV